MSTIEEIFKIISETVRSAIWFDKNEGYWFCSACGSRMDRREKEFTHTHLPFNCSLRKNKALREIRNSVITNNPELYKEYLDKKGFKTLENKEKETPIRKVPLAWYTKQIHNSENLNLTIDRMYNIKEPSTRRVSGAETDSTFYPPITTLKIKPEEQLPKWENREFEYNYEFDLSQIPEWVKNHYEALATISKLELYPELVKNGECDIPNCTCHWVAAQKKRTDDKLAD